MIPRGFAEIRAIEHPPVIAREYLSRGAVVKYVVSRPLEITGKYGAVDYLMIHEFQARGGYGLSFRLAGTPDLNAKVWAIRPGWTIWLQYMGIEQVDPMIASDRRRPEHLWHVGGVMDIPAMRQLMREMETDHRVLDHGIAIEAGILRAADLGVLGVADEEPIALNPTSVEEPRKSEDRPELVTAATTRKPFRVAVSRDLSDEDLNLPPVDRAARPIHALLRSLLKDGAKPREFVEEKMQEAGFSRRQIDRAREAVGVVARRRGVKGRAGGGVWLLEIPGPGKHRTLTKTADVVKTLPQSERRPKLIAPKSNAARPVAVVQPPPRSIEAAAPKGPAFVIQQAVALEWEVTPAELRSEKRTAKLAAPRQVAMYLMRELLHSSHDAIGAAFGGRDRSTVIHSLQRVASRIDSEPFFAQRLVRVKAALAHLQQPSIAAVNDTHR